RNQKRQHEQFSHHGEDEPQDQGGNQAGDDKREVWNVSLLNAVSAIITSPPQGGFLMARDVSSPWTHQGARCGGRAGYCSL
ncbi:hypothetical protein, partial [Tritonibacter sp. SIMBA_163]|uniref:hypothetical protein n=1 Tax=Tritonibacter sp. SIMBA_163 TaxID=3080868 RepID=UPI0039815C1A